MDIWEVYICGTFNLRCRKVSNGSTPRVEEVLLRDGIHLDLRYRKYNDLSIDINRWDDIIKSPKCALMRGYHDEIYDMIIKTKLLTQISDEL